MESNTLCKVSGRVLAVVVTLVVCSGLHAELITVTFDGPLAYIADSLLDDFTIGDPMHVSITYESTTPDYWPAEPGYAMYLAITSLDVSVGGYTASGSNGDFVIKDNVIGYDVVSGQVLSAAASVGSPFPGTLTGPGLDGMPLWAFNLGLSDSTQTALSSDALPTSFDTSLFDSKQLSLAWRNDTGHGVYNDRIVATDFTSTVVPVPSAILLAGMGVALVGWMRRRRTL